MRTVPSLKLCSSPGDFILDEKDWRGNLEKNETKARGVFMYFNGSLYGIRVPADDRIKGRSKVGRN